MRVMQKKTVSLALLLFLCQAAIAQLPVAQSEQVLIEQAQQLDRPYLVELRTTWCGVCKMFERETLTDSAVLKQLNTRFVAAQMDAEKGGGLALGKKYKVRAFPTLLFFYKDGTLLGKMVGYQEPAYFMYNLEVFVKKYEKKKAKAK